MGKVRLRVQTVPATDPVTLQEHIAYNVIAQDGDGNSVLLAPGWTLRDAIETLSDIAIAANIAIGQLAEKLEEKRKTPMAKIGFK